MRSRRSFWSSVLFPLLFGALLVDCSTSASSQAPAVPAASAAVVNTGNSRACSANPVLAPSGKSKSAKKSKHPLPPEPLPVCVEVKGEPIEIQEFLQSVVRKLQWRTGENHASEDTWAFVRYLNEEELAKYGDTKVLVEPVEFTSGKAAITIRTVELGDGFSRVQIAAHIQGEGKSTDKVWAQPGNVWTLRSKEVLEKELTDALQSRYKHAE
jgi:hypothetical protein